MILWPVVLLASITFVLWPQRAPRADPGKVETPEEKWRPNDGKLKVYGDDEKTFTLWSRDEAIKFGFDNVVNSIVYLWVAASVLLGLIGRFMIDPLLDTSKGKLIQSPFALILIRHSAIGALISICIGFYAYQYFVNIVNDEEFSIYDGLLNAVFCQIVIFILAAVLLMCAINSVVKKHLKERANSEDKTAN